MNDPEIAAMFRQGELERRLARTKLLLANAEALQHEQLSPEELAAHKEAVARVHKVRLALEKELSPGYWKRLWAAICGR